MTLLRDLPEPITLRPKRDSDDAFLRRAYESSRDDELANVTWKSGDERAAFFRHQFDAQALHFEGTYDSLDYDIIEHDGTPIGRLVLSWDPEHLHCVDLILLPEYRRGGLGSALMHAITGEADRRGVSASLFYEKWKPYLGPLYAKFGFAVVKEYDAHYYMERGRRG